MIKKDKRNHSPFQIMLYDLRQEHRIKDGVDFCYMIKCGRISILSENVWFKTIHDHCLEYGIKAKITVNGEENIQVFTGGL